MRMSPFLKCVCPVAGVFVAVAPCSADQASGDDQSTESAVREAVVELSTLGAESGGTVLPAGTTVDRAEWVADLLHIDLTVPADEVAWQISDLELELICRVLGGAYEADETFGGTVVRVRAGREQPYVALDAFLPYETPAPWAHDREVSADVPVVQERTPAGERDAESSERGPVTQATRQPTGALSGVTVFTTGGHGWTAGSTWYLQRPVLLGMAEDYGNLDQLNYFVHYAFNAGATVVPFRPVGWQDIEIVLDNDDPGVTYTGSWTDSTGSKYYENNVTISGVSYRWASADVTETATARYTPVITVTDFYPVYGFAIAGTNRTLQTYRIKHSGGTSEVAVDHREVGNGWIWLGEYYFEAGGENYVEITNESPDSGVVIADAIRWGGGMGDLVRPGPGTVSGYPRDEECHRYWAHSELGNNAVGFSAGSIWDHSTSDQNDNIRTAAHWAREMNQVPAGGVQVDRWKRIYLEFHTNAFNGTARGCIALITNCCGGATTNQAQYAAVMANEVDADLLVVDNEFEHSWHDRASPTYTSGYGAIGTDANGDEFDATIIELAYHDNQLDAELLRDDRVRAAMARSCLHGVIRFLSTLPGSQVPLAFPPDTPPNVRAEDAGGGDIVLSWSAPPSDGARGDPATGYVVYQSSNGYGFGDPVTLGNVLTTTVSGVPAGETRYFRIAAANAGGESMPSEVLAVRRAAQGTASVLIVNGFDRLRRLQNPIQTFTQPPAYAGLSVERQIWRRTNSFDYAVQFAQALEATSVGFVSCANEAVIDSQVQLGDYEIVLWILGTESTEDSTFTSTEQSKVTSFLSDGGALFVSGAEIGFDLINQGGGASFMQDTLRAGYSADDAATFNVTGAAGGILSGIGAFDFDPVNGAPYVVYTPDVLTPQTDAMAVLDYVGGTGGIAGVQYDDCIYRVVTFGFPFETITSAATRAAIMQEIISHLQGTPGPLPFDFDEDCDVDLNDFGAFIFCYQGPDFSYPPGHFCLDLDGDGDSDVDVVDYALLQQVFTGSP
ncbi:MAG: golvesin C-terminal-like domain-containing protein [Planctomycetota bacterium]